jgi:iron(III) transport system substrate-binding protein
MRPVRLPGAGRTIAIPNTIALIRGTPRLAAAQQLADHLLSAETELALARGAARQIPLGPVADTDLPAEVRELRRWANEAGPLTGLGAAPAECLAWLKSEYLK